MPLTRGSGPAGCGCGRSRVGMRGAAAFGRPPAAGRGLQAVLRAAPRALGLQAAGGRRGPRLEAGPAGICIHGRRWLAAHPRLRPLAADPGRGR